MKSVSSLVLVRVILGGLCFGFLWSRDSGNVVEAPPVARWTVGRSAWEVCNYYHKRGAKVEYLSYDAAVRTGNAEQFRLAERPP